jgi:hypothetical protein
MTIQCTLLNQSVSYDRESFSANATYHIYDDAGALVSAATIMTDTAVAGVLNGGALTSYGAFLAGTGAYAAGGPKLRYAGYSLSNDGSGAKWNMTVNFDSAQSSYSPSAAAKDTIPEDTPGFTAIEMDISAAIVPTYRVDNYTLPTGGDINAPTEVDIGGKPCDQGGEPIDAFVSVMRFTIRNVQGGRVSNTAMSNILSMVNTRNNAPFTINGFSAAAGKLLLTGVQISRVKANVYELTYGFAYDDDYHLRQMPKVDANGKPQLAVLSGGALTITDATVASVDASATGGIAPRYAYHVMWKQPFPQTSNFDSLSIIGLNV